MPKMDPEAGYVHVLDDRGAVHPFGPDDDVPEWAASKMGAHVWADGEHPYPDSDYPGRPKRDTQPAPEPPERQPGQEPPRAGAGATRDAWAEFAREKGQDVAPEAKRDEIIATLIAEKIIPETPGQ